MTATELPSTAFFVEPADYRIDLDALRAVRETVFVIEQKVPLEEEWDEYDPVCLHVLARDTSGVPIGTARMTRDGKIGRIAVLAEWRGKGVGKAMVRSLLDQAVALGLHEVRLNAQTGALDFYRQFGFTDVGERFMEAGIEHQAMRMTLAPADPPPRAPSDLPESQPAQAFEGLNQAAEALSALIPGARQLVRIHSFDLEPGLLGQTEVLSALRAFATGQRGARVLILVQNAERARSLNNGLFDLAQRMTSCFQFRSPVEAQDMDYPAAFVVSDRGGFLYRPLHERVEGESSICLPARARQLIQRFDAAWERSRPCTEFRALGI
ncbi:MAG: GNAT family N-acetyltransferase [Gammaproteobacteria bacterium HGW-Gammaproteobacteria-7]|nr:MAG: GNAT family N-acetyltransferase [Gammaproteobacteria bacterium HGW-Gammaproteobacteria-7]